MTISHKLLEGMREAGIDFVTSVPCINLQELLLLVAEDGSMRHVPATREEEGIGLCAGAWIGGMRPAILMQNSGLGNCINALASLNLLYGIPVLMIISHRGTEGETISGQVPMGKLTQPLLSCMGIPAFSPDRSNAMDSIVQAMETAVAGRKPAAVLLDLKFWRAGK
jgi:sulfopyruvate decarboxylase subunit alpha